jgi:protein-tyrosine phosphatase
MSNSIIPKILFVCTGNICRSPAAEVIWKHYVKQHFPKAAVFCDSAGTTSYHCGDPIDPRMQQALKSHGYQPDGKARTIHENDATSFDWILAMDRSHLDYLKKRFSKMPEALQKVQLFGAFSGLGPNVEIPDPYYGGEEGFHEVINLIEKACSGLERAVLN